MVIHKFDQFCLFFGWSIPQTVLWTFGKSLVGTNSVWGSVVSAKEIFSPESVSSLQGREIFVHIY
jgi:hypothetical protein